VAPSSASFHAGEALVEHLAASRSLICSYFCRASSLRQSYSESSCTALAGDGESASSLQLAEAGVVVQRARQFLALSQHRIVEQLFDLLQGAV